MKKWIVVISILLTLALTGQAVAEDSPKDNKGKYSYVWLSVGPKDYKQCTSIGLGIRAENLGLEGGYAGKSDYEAKDLLDHPAPPTDCESLGKKAIGRTFGLDILCFINPMTKGIFSLYGGCGLYRQAYHSIAKSRRTGHLHTMYVDNNWILTPSAGLHFFPTANFRLGLGWHFVRGYVGQAGFSF